MLELAKNKDLIIFCIETVFWDYILPNFWPQLITAQKTCENTIYSNIIGQIVHGQI